MLEVTTNFSVACVLFIGILQIICYLIKKYVHHEPKITIYENEKFFLNPEDNKIYPFPNNINPQEKRFSWDLYLSVIIPAYNEEKRLPSMLNEALEYLENRRAKLCDKTPWSPPKGNDFTYEVIVVDDGSTDRTSEVALKYCSKYGIDKFRVLTLRKNRGKGGAVRLGSLSSRGKLILFADADGATQFSDLEKLENFIYETTDNEIDLLHSISIGSRAHLEKDSIAKRSIFRTLLMYFFHFFVWFFTVRTVRDTQCGFKLLGRNIALILFNWMHIETWTFDVELLYLAEKFNCNLGEIAVNWKEIEGSKIVPVFSWLRMGKDLITISFMYFIGAWVIPTIKEG